MINVADYLPTKQGLRHSSSLVNSFCTPFVADYLPTKQGLRLLSRDIDHRVLVADYLPTKQGLRPFIFLPQNCRNAS